VEIRGNELTDTDQRRREPVAKQIFGREELDKYGDVSVTDVLKRLPGVTLSGGNPRLRGLGAGYTLILVNGEPAPPGFSLENLPPAQVERIEVTKGPTAEHSAQAVAGTINIILRAAPRQRQRELRVGLGYSAEAPTPSFNASLGDRTGGFSYTLPLSAYQWRGTTGRVIDRMGRDAAQLPQQWQVSADDRWWGGGASFGPRLSFKPDEQWTIESQTFAQRHEWHAASAVDTQVLLGSAPTSVLDQSHNRGHWQTLRTGLQVHRRSPQGQRLEARFGVQHADSRYRTDVDGFNDAGVQTVVRLAQGFSSEQRRSTSGKFFTPLAEAHGLSVGWDLELRRRREARSLLENGLPVLADIEGEAFRARVQRTAVYVQDEWEIGPHWSTVLGLRAERIDTVSRSSADERRSTSTVVTPLWHLNYKLDPKGRDLIRASLTRAYRAPELSALMARPSINTAYPASGTNTEINPDRVGNPLLQPELSTGLDIAFEKYLPGGGVLSLGTFHRQVHGLIRNRVTLESVAWSPVPRWVSRPVNLSRARSSGVELEIKGRAGELLLAAWGAPVGLSLRASLSAYRSTVDDIPGPDNRLEGQQPLSFTAGLDHAVAGTPLTWGFNLALTPAYEVQQTADQRLAQGRARSLDAYLLWTVSREVSFRLAGNNVWPLDDVNRVWLVDDGGLEQSTRTLRRPRPSFNANLTVKF
jgi:iron complex outermembrane receptor protein